jgi:hypothetical protein
MTKGKVTCMPKPLVVIEDWAVVKSGAYIAYEDLQPGNVLTGKVYGHESMPDAKLVFTSAILSVDKQEGMVETRNTMYRLGKPSAAYGQSEACKSWDCERDLTSSAA